MCAVPGTEPVTIPVDPPTPAIDGEPLVHVPPGVASVSAVVEATHTDSEPVIGGSDEVTVITTERVQPDGIVYTTVDVPAVRPLTRPVVDPTVATVVLLLLQAPPRTDSLKLIVAPSHTEFGPVIVAGSGFTVTIVVAVQPVAISV